MMSPVCQILPNKGSHRKEATDSRKKTGRNETTGRRQQRRQRVEVNRQKNSKKKKATGRSNRAGNRQKATIQEATTGGMGLKRRCVKSAQEQVEGKQSSRLAFLLRTSCEALHVWLGLS